MSHRRSYIPNLNPRLRPAIHRKVLTKKDGAASLDCRFCDREFKVDEVTTTVGKKGEPRPSCPKCGSRFYITSDGSLRTGMTVSELRRAA